MKNQHTEKLYSDEFTLTAPADIKEFVQLNLKQILKRRQQFDIPIIGIAGADGKTTTKGMISAILSKFYNILETPLDCNTADGLTSTLLKLDNSHEIAVLELGIVMPEQFEWAVRVTQPTIAVITNIGEAHLATHEDKFLIADAKVELVRNLPKDGYAILNIDDELVSGMARFSPTPNVIKFGLNKNARFYATHIQHLGPEGMVFTVNSYYQFHLPIFSSALIYNVLAAISVARVFNIEFSDIQDALQNRFQLVEHRGNLVRKNDVNILDHTYDATINSVTKACESLVQFKPYSKKLILVIGDIRNPGPNPKETHLKMGYYIAALPIDVVLTVGKHAKYIAKGIKRLNHSRKKVQVCKDSAALEKCLTDEFLPGSTALFIGSHELALQEVLQQLLQRL